MNEKLQIEDITVDVLRKNIKNMNLRVYPPGDRVLVTVPLGLTDDAVRLWTRSKLEWIKRHRKRYMAQRKLAPGEFKEGEAHHLFGRVYTLSVVEGGRARRVVLGDGGTLELHLPPGSVLEERRALMNAWYRKQMRPVLEELVDKWEKRLGLKVEQCLVRVMKSRWGTCNPATGRIWLNLELAKKPPACLEYIVLHEMLHLRVRSHGKLFKRYLDRHMPDWKEVRDELDRFPVSHAEWNY